METFAPARVLPAHRARDERRFAHAVETIPLPPRASWTRPARSRRSISVPSRPSASDALWRGAVALSVIVPWIAVAIELARW